MGTGVMFLRVLLFGNRIREIHLCVRPAFDEAIEVEVTSHHISTYLVIVYHWVTGYLDTLLPLVVDSKDACSPSEGQDPNRAAVVHVAVLKL